MSHLSKEQVNTINDVFWSDGEPACPACGAILEVNVSTELGFPKDLFVYCPSCGIEDQIRSAAEEGGEIEETIIREMVTLALRGDSPRCPLDGTRLKIEKHGILDGTNSMDYFLECPQCGANGETKWDPDEADGE